MATAHNADTPWQELEYKPVRKDNIRNACFAAFSSALATVNFGYALGYTAETKLRHFFKAKAGDASVNACSNFDIFAVRSFYVC